MTKPPETTTDDALPKWFDPALHHAGTGGAVETATGILLDAEGLPANAAFRAARLAAQLAAQPAERTAPVAAPASKTPAGAAAPDSKKE